MKVEKLLTVYADNIAYLISNKDETFLVQILYILFSQNLFATVATLSLQVDPLGYKLKHWYQI